MKATKTTELDLVVAITQHISILLKLWQNNNNSIVHE